MKRLDELLDKGSADAGEFITMTIEAFGEQRVQRGQPDLHLAKSPIKSSPP